MTNSGTGIQATGQPLVGSMGPSIQVDPVAVSILSMVGTGRESRRGLPHWTVAGTSW
jgi:hypothetical protein